MSSKNYDANGYGIWVPFGSSNYLSRINWVFHILREVGAERKISEQHTSTLSGTLNNPTQLQ